MCGLSPAGKSIVESLAGRFACAGVVAVGSGALRVLGRLELSFRASAAMKGFTALAGFLAVTLFGCGDSCNEEDMKKSRGRSEAGGVADRSPRAEGRLVLLFRCVGSHEGFGAEAVARAWLAESRRQGVVAEQAVRGVNPCGAGDEPRCITDNTVTAGADGVDCDGYQKLYDCYKDCCDLDGTEEALKQCAGWGGRGRAGLM